MIVQARGDTMNRRGVCVWFLSGICATAVFAGDTFAKPGAVKTREGQTYEGEIEEKDADTVVVNSRGIKTTITRNRIASIDYAQDFEKQFRDRMAKLAPNDAAGRLQLAREAFDARQYALARDAAEAARQIDPNNTDATSMLETTQSQIRLERAQQQQQQQAGAARGETANGGPAGDAGEAGGDAGTTTQPAQAKVLKPDQINAIRQAELRPEDVGIRANFSRDVLKRFAQYTARQPSEINAMTLEEKVQRVLKEGTPEMRRDVLILNDPPAMFQYRRNVQPFVLQNCATAGCHGPVNPAKFSLVSPGDSDAAAYTNFYVLNQYTKPTRADGNNVFSGGDLRMIDRQRPDKSLLLQYGLPGAISDYDHPDVPGFRPPFRGLNDPRYRQVLNWVGESLAPVPPEYGFTFGAPPASQPAATQAATEPTTTPAAAATRPTRSVAPPPPQPRTPAAAPQPVPPPPPPPAPAR
jgi:hypothetical protein